MRASETSASFSSMANIFQECVPIQLFTLTFETIIQEHDFFQPIVQYNIKKYIMRLENTLEELRMRCGCRFFFATAAPRPQLICLAVALTAPRP
jgi:hypothetical protein